MLKNHSVGVLILVLLSIGYGATEGYAQGHAPNRKLNGVDHHDTRNESVRDSPALSSDSSSSSDIELSELGFHEKVAVPIINAIALRQTTMSFDQSSFVEAGRFKKVYRESFEGKPAAAYRFEDSEKFRYELKLQRFFSYQTEIPYTVQLLGVVRSHTIPPYYIAYSDYYNETDLFSFIDKRRRLDPPTVKIIGKQMCDTLVKMHRKKIFHRDVKSENIFIKRYQETNGDGSQGKETIEAGLGDFGLAIHAGDAFSRTLDFNPKAGTLQSMSPRYLKMKASVFQKNSELAFQIYKKNDEWGLGFVILESLLGGLSWAPPHSTHEQIASSIAWLGQNQVDHVIMSALHPAGDLNDQSFIWLYKMLSCALDVGGDRDCHFEKVCYEDDD